MSAELAEHWRFVYRLKFYAVQQYQLAFIGHLHSIDRLSLLLQGDLLNAMLAGRLHLASVFLVVLCELSAEE